MADEGFLKRWSRRKTETRLGQEPPPEPPQEDVADPEPAPAAHADAGAGLPARAPEAEADADAPLRLPTMDDVAALNPDSDYSAFVARGVDQAVRRSALKKLFADPHFNTMDGLDIYIDDYNKPSPVSEAMLASLRHAARLFERAADEQLEASVAPAGEPAPACAVEASCADGAPALAATIDTPQHQQSSPETETR